MKLDRNYDGDSDEQNRNNKWTTDGDVSSYICVYKQRTWNPDLERRVGLLIRYYGSTEDSLDTGYTRNKVQLQFSALGSAVLQASHVPDFFILHIKGFSIYRAGRIN